MEIKERLKLYKRALKDYQYVLDNYSPDISNQNHTVVGFCWYFEEKYDLEAYYRFEEILPELYEQRTTPDFRSVHYYPLGDEIKGIIVRVQALEQAIILTKSKL